MEWSAPFGFGWGNEVSLALLPLAGGQAIAAAASQDAGLSTRLTVDRLATGRLLGSVTLPDLVMAPLTVTGTSVLAQADTRACAVAGSGTSMAPAG